MGGIRNSMMDGLTFSTLTQVEPENLRLSVQENLHRWKIHRLRIIFFPFWNVVMGVSNLCVRYKWQLSYIQITDTHDNILKGWKIILRRWIFNLCTVSCTMPVKVIVIMSEVRMSLESDDGWIQLSVFMFLKALAFDTFLILIYGPITPLGFQFCFRCQKCCFWHFQPLPQTISKLYNWKICVQQMKNAVRPVIMDWLKLVMILKLIEFSCMAWYGWEYEGLCPLDYQSFYCSRKYDRNHLLVGTIWWCDEKCVFVDFCPPIIQGTGAGPAVEVMECRWLWPTKGVKIAIQQLDMMALIMQNWSPVSFRRLKPWYWNISRIYSIHELRPQLPNTSRDPQWWP